MEFCKIIPILLVLGWIIVCYLLISPSSCEDIKLELAMLKRGLRVDISLREELKIKNTELKRQHADRGPLIEVENLRRRIYLNTKELWSFLYFRLKNATSEGLKPNQIQNLLEELISRKRSLLSDQNQFSELDGHQIWKRQEADRVSDLVQRRLYHIQHPRDCRSAKKIVCNHDNCGFSCQLHHLAYCLIFAYATERTLILNNKGWRYSKDWVDSFHPLSSTCNTTYDDKVWEYSEKEQQKVVSLPLLYSLSPKPNFLPLTVPEDLSYRIQRFNGDPASWWIAQMIKYILKPRKHILKQINRTIENMKIQSPIIGVHIRRTDKVDTEAEFHDVEEYMTHVEDYYLQLEISSGSIARRVYLATDNAQLLEEVRKKYPQYKVYGDRGRAESAATHRRYKPPALFNLLVDLKILAMSNYLVCTFSSQFCLLAYEMMQANRVDASNSFYSLDDLYHFVGQIPHRRMIVHNFDNPLQQMGVEINSSGLWTGYNRRGKKSRQDGLIPWYKTVDNLDTYRFPEYKAVPIT